VPPNCGMVPSGMQENCVKSAKQIKILGIVKGHHLLPSKFQSSIEQNAPGESFLQPGDEPKMQSFLQDLGLLFHKLKVDDRAYIMDDFSMEDWPAFVENPEFDEEALYWTRSWDDCYENCFSGTQCSFARNHVKLLQSP